MTNVHQNVIKVSEHYKTLKVFFPRLLYKKEGRRSQPSYTLLCPSRQYWPSRNVGLFILKICKMTFTKFCHLMGNSLTFDLAKLQLKSSRFSLATLGSQLTLPFQS